ncbi:MAG: hypothetical protein CMC19_09940 [Flavobacteriaceae bacterium]|nr:hypothetical protein [Flavobacteriaceae bacterium]MAJ38210.1 hypothetical protein [Flavobacteriaceae bacterium]
MKKIIVRETFWFLLSVVLSLLLSFVFLEILQLTSTNRNMNKLEQVFSVQLYIIGCFMSIIFIYVVRVIAYALKFLILKKE